MGVQAEGANLRLAKCTESKSGEGACRASSAVGFSFSRKEEQHCVVGSSCRDNLIAGSGYEETLGAGFD